MKASIQLSLVFAIVIGIFMFTSVSAETLNQSLGESIVDGNMNAIGAYKWSAYNFTAAYNYSLDNVTIYVAEDGGLATATNVGVYMINSTNGVNESSFLGNSTNTISAFDVGGNYTWSFANGAINLTSGLKYALVWNAGGAAQFIRVGETINAGAGFSWQAGATLTALNFNVNSQVTSVNVKLFGTGYIERIVYITPPTDVSGTIKNDANDIYVSVNITDPIGINWTQINLYNSTGYLLSYLYNNSYTDYNYKSFYNQSSYCYQESANVSTACGANNIGGYTYYETHNWVDPSNVYDGDWNTYGYYNGAGGEFGTSTMSISYEIPANGSYYGNVLTVKDGTGIHNISIPKDGCVSEINNNIVIGVVSRYDGSPVSFATWYCAASGNTLYTVSTSYNNRIYEEAMIWNVTNPVLNTTNNVSYTKSALASSNFTDLGDGLYYFNVTYQNINGINYSTSTRNVTINASIPVINFISPTPDDNYIFGLPKTNIIINLSMEDYYYSNTTLNIYNSSGSLIYTNFTTAYNLTYIFTPSTYGTYYYNATAWNNKSNYKNTDTRSVTFSDFQFGLCNSTLTVPYLNILFLDEEIGISMDAQIKNFISTYYVFDSSVTKTYTLTNLTSNPSYAFCSTPSFKPVNITLSFTYTNTSYTQKTYSGTFSYTNETTNLVLNLLSLVNTHIVSFQTLDSRSVPISDVYVQIYSVSGLISSQVFSGYTDTTGVIGTYLNGLNNYIINYTKAGYLPYTQTIQPVLSSYSIYMTAVSSGEGDGAGSSGSATGGGSYIPISNISWRFSHTPDQWFFNTSSSVQVLFNVTTSDTHYGGSRIEVWSNLTNMVNWTAVNKSVGNLTQLTLNQSFGNYTALTFKYFIYNSSNLNNFHLVYSETFRVVNISEGGHTIARGIRSWGSYVLADGFEEAFGTAWWVFFFLCIGVSVFCYTTGIELTNPMAISIGITMALGGLSYAGLLYVPGLVNEFVSKYIIVIITALFNVGYIASMWRERA